MVSSIEDLNANIKEDLDSQRALIYGGTYDADVDILASISKTENEFGIIRDGRLGDKFIYEGNNTLYCFYLSNGGMLKAENMSNDQIANNSRCWAAFSGINGTEDELMPEYSDVVRKFGQTGVSTDGYIDFPSTVKMVVFAHFNGDVNKLAVYRKTKQQTDGIFADLTLVKDTTQNLRYIKTSSYTDYAFDEKPIISRFFSEREHHRDKYINSNSVSIYWDINDGNDENDGLSSTNPVKSFQKAKSLLTDGSILYIKYGSIITDICNFDKGINGLRIDAYGNMDNGNPIFENLIIVQSANIEKVDGYDHIYRIKHTYEASASNVTNMQAFCDGKRLGTVKMGTTGYATTSNKYTTNFNEAMSILENNYATGDAWFSGYDGGESWEAGDYYFYISLPDDPSNHKIEITNHVSACLLDMYRLVNADIRHINTRGSAGKDGWNTGTNVYLEDCHILDHAHHGFLSFNGFQRAYKCSAVSLSGAIGYQFHHYGFNDDICMDSENIYIDCIVRGSRNIGNAFNGHMTAQNSICYNNYIINCYVEGVNNVCGASVVKQCVIKNLTVNNVSCLVNSGNKIIIENVRGSIYASDKAAIYGNLNFNVDLVASNIIIEITAYNGIGGLLYDIYATDDSKSGKANCKHRGCIFLIRKPTIDSINPSQTGAIMYIGRQSNYEFIDCTIAVEKADGMRDQILMRSNLVDVPIKMTNCIIFGLSNNSNFAANTEYFNDCLFGVDTGEMGSLKWLQRTSYVDNGIIKRAIL